MQSLSARRAWIEIKLHSMASRLAGVALRKESVDRNDITPAGKVRPWASVALRKESVDRNTYGRCVLRIVSGRSPQGERG